MIFLAVWLPLGLLVLGLSIWTAWFMQHDKGQRAAPRSAGRHAPLPAVPGPRIIRRAATAGEPPAVLTDTPCAEPPPPAPYFAADAPAVSHPAIPALPS